MIVNIILIIMMLNESFCLNSGNQKIMSKSYEKLLPFAEPNIKENEYNSQIMLQSNLNINNMIILRNELLKPIQSPGETSLLPISINAKGRLEIVASVISTAIFLLTLSIKWQETFNRDSNINSTIQELSYFNNESKYSKDINQMDNGIKIMNQKLNKNNIQLIPGDKLQIVIKLFFNGLEIDYNNKKKNVYEIDMDTLLDMDKIDFDKLDINLPFPCLKDIINNMSVGSKTKLSIPSDLAFGQSGLPPFVPGNVSILCEISLLKISF